MNEHEHDSDEWAADPMRAQLIEWLSAQRGKLYVWGAKGPDYWDCSGLVTGSMYALGIRDWRATHNAARLFAELEPIEFLELAPGDLCFYGQPAHVSHVMLYWTTGEVYGASGGNSGTTTPEIAASAGACVRTRSSPMYRPDVRGYRRYPSKPPPPAKEPLNA